MCTTICINNAPLVCSLVVFVYFMPFLTVFQLYIIWAGSLIYSKKPGSITSDEIIAIARTFLNIVKTFRLFYRYLFSYIIIMDVLLKSMKSKNVFHILYRNNLLIFDNIHVSSTNVS